MTYTSFRVERSMKATAAQVAQQIITPQSTDCGSPIEQRSDTLFMLPEQKANILLVDDQPKNLLALSAILDSPDLIQLNSPGAITRGILTIINY